MSTEHEAQSTTRAQHGQRDQAWVWGMPEADCASKSGRGEDFGSYNQPPRCWNPRIPSSLFLHWGGLMSTREIHSPALSCSPSASDHLLCTCDWPSLLGHSHHLTQLALGLRQGNRFPEVFSSTPPFSSTMLIRFWFWVFTNDYFTWNSLNFSYIFRSLPLFLKTYSFCSPKVLW